MSDIPKIIRCLKCDSFIHDTERCHIWKYIIFCYTDRKYKRECNCSKCINRCKYCNRIAGRGYYKYHHDDIVQHNECNRGHNGSRCTECNEFLCLGNGMECEYDHTRSLCQFCDSPGLAYSSYCNNGHAKKTEICTKCSMPVSFTHSHDGNKCSVCKKLLSGGRCIYKCVGGGIFCSDCGYEGVVNNVCIKCKKIHNTGQFTKRAINK